MRKRFLIAGLMGLLMILLCGCDSVENMGSLPEFSRPYTGEYACERLLLGGEDLTEKFEYVKLDLKNSGEFSIRYKSEEGAEGEYRGMYEVSSSLDEITLSAQAGLRSVSRTFPMEKGKILVDLQFGSRLLHAEFAAP